MSCSVEFCLILFSSLLYQAVRRQLPSADQLTSSRAIRAATKARRVLCCFFPVLPFSPVLFHSVLSSPLLFCLALTELTQSTSALAKFEQEGEVHLTVKTFIHYHSCLCRVLLDSQMHFFDLKKVLPLILLVLFSFNICFFSLFSSALH